MGITGKNCVFQISHAIKLCFSIQTFHILKLLAFFKYIEKECIHLSIETLLYARNGSPRLGYSRELGRQNPCFYEEYGLADETDSKELPQR